MRRGVLLLAAALAASACSEDPAVVETRIIVEELAAQEFGRASTRYRAHEDEVLSEAAAPVWRRALEHDDSTVREWAVDALSRIGLEADRDAVAAALDDASRGVRQQALDGIVRMDAARAREEFLSRLRGDRPEQVALGAQGLAAIEARDAAGEILQRFRDTSLPAATRGALTQPLAALGDPAAAEPLADVALDPDADLALRRLAVEALATLDGPDVEAQLRRLVGADDDYVRTVAAEALAQLEG